MAHNYYMLTLKQLAYRRDCYDGHTREVYFYDQSGCGESILILPTGKTNVNNKIFSKSIRSTLLLDH